MDIIKEIRSRVQLKEPEQIIKNIIGDIYLEKEITTKQLAKRNSLPLPVISAIKKELGNLDILNLEKGKGLTRKGKIWAEQQLGWRGVEVSSYLKIRDCQEYRDEVFKDLVAELSVLSKDRPKVVVELDQAHATVETAVMRALQLILDNNLIGRRILFLGDDDLTSLAVVLVMKKFVRRCDNQRQLTITVFDVDTQLVAWLGQTIKRIGTSVTYQLKIVDFRESFSRLAENKYEVVFIDPPYTIAGLKLFLARGVSMIQKELGTIYLSFPTKDLATMLDMQQLIQHQNLVMDGIERAFNEYQGASIIGGVSNFYRLKSTSESYAIIPRDTCFHQKMYTGELNPKERIYECMTCREMIVVGSTSQASTIEVLKEKGCPTCFQTSLRYSSQRKKVSNQVNQKRGTHLIIEANQCESVLLEKVQIVEETMLKIARECDLTIVTQHFHEFDPWGVSGVIILAESHFTIHTWPEYGYAAIDLFICSDFQMRDKLLGLIKLAFKANELEIHELVRGK